MKESEIIASMTTWPPRAQSAVNAMRYLVKQKHSVPVRFMLALSLDEWNYDGLRTYLPSPKNMLQQMEVLGVDVLWENGNTYSHKKLMPVLNKYHNSAIIVVDDDVRQQDGWLQTFIDDHTAHPTDIIYGSSTSRVDIINNRIVEGMAQRNIYINPGKVTYNIKPANGASGTLYPANTFTDSRFFDKSLYMHLCPTSDETWQWAWAVIESRQHRCLSDHNHPSLIESNQECALWHINRDIYTMYHNNIAREFPIYKDKLQSLINQYENEENLY